MLPGPAVRRACCIIPLSNPRGSAGVKTGGVCGVLLRLSVAAAVAVSLFALAAGLLGIDADQRWGPFRIGLLAAGIGWLACLAILRLIDGLDRRIVQSRRVSPVMATDRTEGTGKEVTTTGQFRPLARRVLVGILFIIAIELLYVWFASATLMTNWPKTTEWYGWLGESFSRGRTDLLVDPDPSLGALSNPYDPAQRTGIPALGDASYFGGRYYAYWGPVPGLLTALSGPVLHLQLGDAAVAFLGQSVAFIFSFLVVLHLRRLYFPDLPTWLLVTGSVVVAVVHPILWNMSYPAVYEAAIAWGQAFLMAGLFFALPVILGRDGSWARVALASGLWGLAIASRYTLGPAVVVLLLASALGGRRAGAWKSVPSRRSIVAASLVPVGLVLACLGWYNFVRFGNPTETGLQYQMQPVYDFTRLTRTGQIFSLQYLAPNLIYYGVVPVRPRAVFPFVGPVRGELQSVDLFLRGLDIPDPHAVEDITGYLVAVPIAVFGVLLLIRSFCPPHPDRDFSDGSASDVAHPARGLGQVLLLAAAVTIVPILLYRHVANRFIMDFSLLAVIASVIGAWELNRSERFRPVGSRLVNGLILGTALWTIVVGLLLAITGPDSRIDDYNPALWLWLAQLVIP